MRVDEMPDVFVADLRRLLELAGHVPTDNDPVLLEQFLHGLPAEFEKELRLTSAGQSMKISACVEKVRALSACTARRSGGGFVAATASAASELSGQSANPEPAGNHRRCLAFCASRASKSGARGGSAQTKLTGSIPFVVFSVTSLAIRRRFVLLASSG